MTVIALIRRLRAEFTAMPGLRLNEEQVQRLCGISAAASASALRALVSAGFLHALEDGSYRRADVAIGAAPRSASAAVQPPWRRILCLVEFKDDSRRSLTAASHSALSYATNLGVTHRAKVTALHLVSSLPADAIEQHAVIEQRAADVRRQTRGMSIPALIDVHVAPDAANEGLLQSARDLRADLIVLGRPDGGTTGVSHLREMLRDAPCHVLLVHPSGQAAVA